ncbi:glycine betaine ABC transporter substrate-binding protein [Aquibacillus sp. 3ASR75-11]|uniref:Glycine betaine ABC transporter substrate-binding protein n=1 Tax=Terrihalobacillus insolitus TaxID=2950438 RepID=A0A9X4AMR5_9BACI|nr:glycine betaine ABC transporter substrate-binding protein [Terrihalobacillus insolitus]MDC3413760.1 glycine betaine ABC transporter substrate-binding protein [Terrihalobacillus insolitus]MDC3425621.1 glycine betaine ABC transporter substrate-binding protein [Terrihalobacillus insolitus]
MFKLKWKYLGLATALLLTLLLAACGGGQEESPETGEGDGGNGSESEDQGESEGVTLGDKELELVYVEWDSEVASTNVIANVLRDQGYDVTITPIDNALMWQSVAQGEADGMVAAWLPGTHGDLYEQYKADLVDLGTNLKGAKIGLVVPEYMDATTIGDLTNFSDELDNKITGIEAGAGVVKAAEQSIEDYGLDGWEVQTSSSGAMATALGQAIDNEEPIVVTGWTPHWKFAKYDLKYLEDPEGSFGGEEEIKTMVRKGLEDDSPAAYQILDQFNWEAADMEEVMLAIQNGTSAEDAAAAWVEDNQDKVDEWVAGLE